MNQEELNAALQEKMAAEQKTYRDWLISQPPEVVLDHATEYSIREDIVMELDFMELSAATATALLNSPTPLADVYKEWQNTETNHMDDIKDVIENRAEYVLNAEREALLNTPVYIQSGAYAREHGEIDVFRASYKANIACRKAIEAAITENYNDNVLETARIYEDVVNKFGQERVKLVLATTVYHKIDDERFSRENRAWAKTVPMEACFGSRDNDHSYSYVVESHSGLMNMVVSRFRAELAKEKEQPQRESILKKLNRPLPVQPAKPGKATEYER